MRHSFFAALFLLSITAFAQDVKIQGPQKQSSVSTQNQNANAKTNQQSQPAEQIPVPPSRSSQDLITETFSVNGVSFKMCYVKGGDYLMGATPEQESNDSNELPVHKVSLPDYYIGQTEVTNSLWNEVMGTSYSGNDLPVHNVSWNDCDNFIVKLNSLTGLIFRLPTEEEWEYAARGGNNSKDYRYSGSNYPEDVAWYKYNSGEQRHSVATKQANELGIYDMTGNVKEWCNSTWHPSYDDSWTNGSKVYRDGSYKEGAQTISHRYTAESYMKLEGLGFRIAITRIPPQYREQERLKIERQQQLAREEVQRKKDAEKRNALRWDDATKTFYYNGQSYKMTKVEGGTFTMGTKKKINYMEPAVFEMCSPAHSVTLDCYYIGQTEVTNGLLRAIQGDYSGPQENDNYPAVNISWNDCLKIIQYLSQLTGYNFCFPSEAEWEFAAKGGNMATDKVWASEEEANTRGTEMMSRFRGHEKNAQLLQVASKKPNELGIYDMIGNVWEWCEDWYGDYAKSKVSNPHGANYGTQKVCRGGAFNETTVFYVERNSAVPNSASPNLGFRLCLRP